MLITKVFGWRASVIGVICTFGMGLLGQVSFGQKAPDPPHPHSITSITVCRASNAGSAGSCPIGSVDTSQPVLAPDGSVINLYGGLGTLADEHSTIFPPGSLPGHGRDYLLFVAARTSVQPDASGVVALSGNAGPNQNGQWTLDFSPNFGLYNPGGVPGDQNGPTFLSAMQHDACPKVTDAADQDPTFDLNYGDPGTVFLDPTNRANHGSGALLMIYEGTNRCIGRKGPKNSGNNFYSTIGVATSLDFGASWPTYRGSSSYDFFQLPDLNPAQGPGAPTGAFGADVCMGNDCSTTPPVNYGRYAVLSPDVTVAEAIANTTGDLASNMGDSEPAAFVDDIHGWEGRPGFQGDGDDGEHNPFVYVVHNYAPGPFGAPLPNGLASDLTIARAQLNGGRAPLKFTKWYQGSFSESGLGSDGGGLQTPIFPSIDSSLYNNCLAPDQARAMGSISYVEATQQYLLIFVCASPSDPGRASSDPGGGQKGAAWFYSTIDAKDYDLSHQEQWSAPQEITGSWSSFTGTIGGNDGCFRNFNGWYPTMMSLSHKPGQLSTTGYVFYMNGCTDTDTPGGRQFSTRAFTILIR